jgi:hypothetical protein
MKKRPHRRIENNKIMPVTAPATLYALPYQQNILFTENIEAISFATMGYKSKIIVPIRLSLHNSIE